MFKDMSKPEQCECCEGTGKSYFHILHYAKDDLGIIKRTFPGFNPRKSCEDCFGSGEIHPFLTKLAEHELHNHWDNKIFRGLDRRKT